MKFLRCWILPAIFVLVHTPSGDQVRSYDNQDQATIQAMVAVQGFTADFIDQATYQAFLDAHAPVPLSATDQLIFDRTQAVNELNSGTGALTKVERAVLLVLFDENNLLRQRDVDRAADVAAATSLADLKVRWAARSALDQRTVPQAKTAVQNKITSGASD